MREVPQCVQKDVKRVARMHGVSFDNVYYRYHSSVVVRLDLTLDLPTRYDEATALVRAVEPVFVEFTSDYPDRVPRAYIGRNDFDFAHALISIVTGTDSGPFACFEVTATSGLPIWR